jgi:hypothetical protein
MFERFQTRGAVWIVTEGFTITYMISHAMQGVLLSYLVKGHIYIVAHGSSDASLLLTGPDGSWTGIRTRATDELQRVVSTRSIRALYCAYDSRTFRHGISALTDHDTHDCRCSFLCLPFNSSDAGTKSARHIRA